MAKKKATKTKGKKKNMQDGTLINVRAANKRLSHLEAQVRDLVIRVRELESKKSFFKIW